jgi:hypothetical protein
MMRLSQRFATQSLSTLSTKAATHNRAICGLAAGSLVGLSVAGLAPATVVAFVSKPTACEEKTAEWCENSFYVAGC